MPHVLDTKYPAWGFPFFPWSPQENAHILIYRPWLPFTAPFITPCHNNPTILCDTLLHLKRCYITQDWINQHSLYYIIQFIQWLTRRWIFCLYVPFPSACTKSVQVSDFTKWLYRFQPVSRHACSASWIHWQWTSGCMCWQPMFWSPWQCLWWHDSRHMNGTIHILVMWIIIWWRISSHWPTASGLPLVPSCNRDLTSTQR